MHTGKAPEAIDHDRRRLLCAATTSIAVAGAAGLLPALVDSAGDALGQPSQQGASQIAAKADAIRPFSVNFPDEALAELRRRIAATRWPDRETVNDRSQGIQLAEFQQLLLYWATGYDWRKAEAKLNALPQFMTTIDDVDIHFIHVRSRHPNALPLTMTHGWPGPV